MDLVRGEESLYLPNAVFAALARHHTVAGITTLLISERVQLLPHMVADSVFLPMTDCDHGVEGATGTSSFPGRGANWSEHMAAAGEMTEQVAGTLDHNGHLGSFKRIHDPPAPLQSGRTTAMDTDNRGQVVCTGKNETASVLCQFRAPVCPPACRKSRQGTRGPTCLPREPGPVIRGIGCQSVRLNLTSPLNLTPSHPLRPPEDDREARQPLRHPVQVEECVLGDRQLQLRAHGGQQAHHLSTMGHAACKPAHSLPLPGVCKALTVEQLHGPPAQPDYLGETEQSNMLYHLDLCLNTVPVCDERLPAVVLPHLVHPTRPPDSNAAYGPCKYIFKAQLCNTPAPWGIKQVVEEYAVKPLSHVVAGFVFLPMSDCEHGVEGEAGTSSFFPGQLEPFRQLLSTSDILLSSDISTLKMFSRFQQPLAILGR